MNEYLFYASVRESFFKGHISPGAFDTMQTILKECRDRKVYDYRYQAYILATAWHEAFHYTKNPDWNPVREHFAKTNEEAIRKVTAEYNAGRIPDNYAKPAKNGNSYYGRGWPQLTWERNYKAASRLYGVDFHGNPDLVLQRPYAALLLVGGMVEGWYTSVSLSDFITTQKTDFVNARRVVNGLNKAKEIAVTAKKFYNAMIQL